MRSGLAEIVTPGAVVSLVRTPFLYETDSLMMLLLASAFPVGAVTACLRRRLLDNVDDEAAGATQGTAVMLVA